MPPFIFVVKHKAGFCLICIWGEREKHTFIDRTCAAVKSNFEITLKPKYRIVCFIFIINETHQLIANIH